MTTVLFCPVTFNLAETTRMIEVARAVRRVNDVVFLGYEDRYAHLITDAGFDYRPGQPVWSDDDIVQAMKVDQGKALRSPFTHDLVSARVTTERGLIRSLDAKAVVIGSNLTSLISARAEGLPLFFVLPFALTPPWIAQTRRFGLVPGERAVNRALDGVATAAMRLAYGRAPLAPRSFTTVAREHGVPPIRTLAEMFQGDHNLLAVMPWEIEGYKLPDSYLRVGPIFAQLDAALPPLVEELASRSNPLVYLGLGSSANRDVALGAARQLGTLDVNVVAPIRHYLRAGDTVPANVHVTDLLPAHKLGGLIDAAVLHGGQGTVQTACATGVPFVGMGMQVEQVWNIALCEKQGNAIALTPKDAGTPRLAGAVQKLLDDPAYRRQAERIKHEFVAEDGAAASARVIQEHLSRSSR